MGAGVGVGVGEGTVAIFCVRWARPVLTRWTLPHHCPPSHFPRPAPTPKVLTGMMHSQLNCRRLCLVGSHLDPCKRSSRCSLTQTHKLTSPITASPSSPPYSPSQVFTGMVRDPFDCRRLCLVGSQGTLALLTLTNPRADKVDTKQYKVTMPPGGCLKRTC